MIHRWQQRLVAGPVVDVRRGDADRAVGAAVEPAAEGDQPGSAGHAPRELQRRLDCLGAGVREEHRVERLRHDVRDHLRQSADRLEVAQRVADVEELVDLLVDRLRHRRVVVAERGRRDARCEVEVVSAGGVDQLVAFAAVPGTLEVAPEDRRQVRRRERLEVRRGGRDGRRGRVDGGVHRPSIGTAAL